MIQYVYTLCVRKIEKSLVARLGGLAPAHPIIIYKLFSSVCTGIQMELVPGLLQYVTEAVRRIEHKVEMIEVNQSDLTRQLSNIKRKQEMVLTKQDQIQSTLHGDTTVIQSPASSVLAGGVTPPLTSPTSTLTTYPQLPGPVPRQRATPAAVSESDITSVLDDCNIEFAWSRSFSTRELKTSGRTACEHPIRGRTLSQRERTTD